MKITTFFLPEDPERRFLALVDDDFGVKVSFVGVFDERESSQTNLVLAIKIVSPFLIRLILAIALPLTITGQFSDKFLMITYKE